VEVPVQSLFCPSKEPITYLKNDRDLFVRRQDGLVRNKDKDFKKLLWKIAEYLAKKNG